MARSDIATVLANRRKKMRTAIVQNFPKLPEEPEPLRSNRQMKSPPVSDENDMRGRVISKCFCIHSPVLKLYNEAKI